MTTSNILNIIGDMTPNSRWRPPKVSPLQKIYYMKYNHALKSIFLIGWDKPNMLNVTMSSAFNLTPTDTL